MDKQMWLIEYPSYSGPSQHWATFEDIELWRMIRVPFVVIGSTGCQV